MPGGACLPGVTCMDALDRDLAQQPSPRPRERALTPEAQGPALDVALPEASGARAAPAASPPVRVNDLLLPGDWAEVLPAAAIAAGLDSRGTLEGLPFMPEMARHCGHRFRVLMRAERTCVHPPQGPHRRLSGTVVLEGLRCDGAAHGGCQLGCMFLWKESWLRRVDGPGIAGGSSETSSTRATGPVDGPVDHEDARYVCQATELPRATEPGEPLWRPGQYLRMLRVRTFSIPGLVRELARPGLRWVVRRLRVRRRNVAPTPPVRIGLQPRQWVEVRSKEEILATLDAAGRHRGLPFSGEMYAFCGRKLRVEQRVERIIDESTGRLRSITDTVILEGSLCERYLGCARGMPILWREAWLKPVAAPAAQPEAGRCMASSSCHRS